MSKHPPTIAGVIAIDKPAGITSHDAVAAMRRITGIRRIGHTGTLDPFATGLLLLVVGSATRLAEHAHDLAKTYEATVVLGATSDTDDGTGKITPQSARQPQRDLVAATLQQFVGPIQQVPPAYAALKRQGKRLYVYARAGENIPRLPRPVTIETLELIHYHYPYIDIRVVSRRGTYIRALARDIGQSLETGAYLKTLRRTKIGKFTVQNSPPLAQVTAHNFPQLLQPSRVLVEHLPALTLTPDNVAQLKQGRSIPWSSLNHPLTPDSPLALLDSHGDLIGIGHFHPPSATLSPHKIL
ncbi:MAG: tRNA pseudouridine(55) synthase TruB [Candidatus Andersenbacteria bacterium]